MKRAPIKPRSKKRAKLYRDQRVPLVKRLLEERPICQRCQEQRSTEIHERTLRSAGADILDESDCVALCRQCHSGIHAKPAQSQEDGWLRTRFGDREI
jgi:5-methylcytosine-specific restriction endonuclease McrA